MVYPPNDEELATLACYGMQVGTTLIECFDGFADGMLEDGPMGMLIRVDEGKATSVPYVFAYGDAARAAHRASMF